MVGPHDNRNRSWLKEEVRNTPSEVVLWWRRTCGGRGEGRAGAGVSLIPDVSVSLCVVHECQE